MRGLHAVIWASLALPVSAAGQGYTISTVAGGGLPVNMQGTTASLYGPQGGIAIDRSGNVYFTDQNEVLRLDAKTGILTLAAGNGTQGFSGDNGPAVDAQLYNPSGLALDSTGRLYIADTDNNRIRRVANGVITTVAGCAGAQCTSGDVLAATTAQLNAPQAVAVDSAGNLYIADTNIGLIRKVTNGVIATVTSTDLNTPVGLAFDSAGDLYIADMGFSRIVRIANGVSTTVAGNGTLGFSGDGGPASSAALNHPQAVAVDSAGNVYIADSGNNVIRKVANGMISTIAGEGTGPIGDNGPAIAASLSFPSGVALDSAGDLYIADDADYRLRKVTNGTITTVAGNGTLGFSGDSGLATNAELNSGFGWTQTAVDSAGNLYIADAFNNRVRKVAGGIITTVAGTGAAGYSGDNGPAISAKLNSPQGVAVDSAGNLYIAEAGNNVIRKVSNGMITTLAGNGKFGFSGDNGPAISAEFKVPYGLAVDLAGNLYIADNGNNRIRKVANGVITTVAGNGKDGFSGDNGLATSAELSIPYAVAVDSAGNLYIADTGNSRIRKVANGVIATVAGGGSGPGNGDGGSPTGALLFPEGIAVDSAGNLYIADAANDSVRRVAGGVIATIAGVGKSGFGGDNGPAALASFNIYPALSDVAIDPVGNVYATDNNRVRLLTPGTPPASLQPESSPSIVRFP
jgi:sugar lactone lactonase YvrE